MLPFFLWYNLSLKLRIKDSLTSCSDCHETGLPRSSIVIWIQKTISRNRVTNPVCARCTPRHVNNQHRVHAHAHTHTARVIISRMCPPDREVHWWNYSYALITAHTHAPHQHAWNIQRLLSPFPLRSALFRCVCASLGGTGFRYDSRV